MAQQQTAADWPKIADLEGKRILITGASTGIGAAAARAFGANGARVGVHYNASRDKAELVAGDVEAAGGKAVLIGGDVTKSAEIKRIMAGAAAGLGGLDVLVNNAGYGSYGALEDVPMDEGRCQGEVNLMGLARLSQLVIPLMRAQKSGTIVNVTSVGGKLGEPFGSWYHATKFAVEGLSDCMRLELKPFGVRVIVIEPGAIRSEWNEIARDSLIAQSGGTAYGPYARRHAAMLGGAEASSMASPPEVVARTIGKAVAARNPRPRYATGGGAKLIMFLTWLLPDRLTDRLLWRMSQSVG
ncbi:MAG: SDR family NAD(P)-dependent oxidoreductase [Porphyrobacter sp.]|nr:SDR family NAD(P)-dependent oxidoreductase [Porphyrobacter sp.]